MDLPNRDNDDRRSGIAMIVFGFVLGAVVVKKVQVRRTGQHVNFVLHESYSVISIGTQSIAIFIVE